MTADPQSQTTAAAVLRSHKIFEIAHRRATEAMAQIAERQMKTWDKFPSPDGPTDLITRAILGAIEDAGVKSDG